jgi:uncharacterized protein
MTDRPLITPRQRRILRDVLRPFADEIESVGVFGSRAIGTARPNSDIDLVIYGTLTSRQVDRLWTLFNESSLEVTVDICAYQLISHAALRRHIDTEMVKLFERSDLNFELAA